MQSRHKGAWLDQSKDMYRDIIQNIWHQDVLGSPGDALNKSIQQHLSFLLSRVYVIGICGRVEVINYTSEIDIFIYLFFQGQVKLFCNR